MCATLCACVDRSSLADTLREFGGRMQFGCKDTKKFPYIKMNMGNSFKFLLFSTEMRDFEGKSSISYTIFGVSHKYILVLICSC